MTGQPRVELTKEPRPIRPCAGQDRASLREGGERPSLLAVGVLAVTGSQGPFPRVSKRGCEARSLPELLSPGARGR